MSNRSLNAIFTIFLLAFLTSCSTTEPIQQKDIDESQYFDPRENLSSMTSYSPPRMEAGYEKRLDVPYPAHLMRNGTQDTVIMRLYVSETGEVDYAAIEQSVHTALDYPLQRKIIAEKLAPARLDGKPVKSVFRYEKEFELHMIQTVRRVNNQ